MSSIFLYFSNFVVGREVWIFQPPDLLICTSLCKEKGSEALSGFHLICYSDFSYFPVFCFFPGFSNRSSKSFHLIHHPEYCKTNLTAEMFQVLETAVKLNRQRKQKGCFRWYPYTSPKRYLSAAKYFFCHCPQKQCRKRKHQYDIFKAFRRQCDRAVCRRVPDPPASHNIRQRIDPHISVDQCLKQDHHCKNVSKKSFRKNSEVRNSCHHARNAARMPFPVSIGL